MPTRRSLVAFSLLAGAAPAALAAATVGQAAPAFSAADTAGRKVALADFKGRHVVLEWVNPGCPYVRKHYDSANMQGTQKSALERGVAWLAINTTTDGHADYLAPAAMARWMQQHGAAPTATLMDTDGTIGRLYGARTTPQMVVIDPAGRIVYTGAIDSIPSAHAADIKAATNHVRQALAEVLAGKAVSVPATRPYGCSVKYAPA